MDSGQSQMILGNLQNMENSTSRMESKLDNLCGAFDAVYEPPPKTHIVTKIGFGLVMLGAVVYFSSYFFLEQK